MQLLGHEFKNDALAEEALTTPSYRMLEPTATDNQRLEFLGDAVIGMLAAERLHQEFPTASEGELTVKRTHMVSTAALCAAAARLELASLLRRNYKTGKLPANSKTFADAIEAIVGAAYLDGGLDAAREVFAVLELEVNAEEGRWCVNSKGELQIRAQSMKPPRHPEYELISVLGKAHEPVFTVRVTVADVGTARATARTRREAESLAAAALLKIMGARP